MLLGNIRGTIRMHVTREGVVKIDAPVEGDADRAAAMALCERLSGAIRDFDQRVRELRTESWVATSKR
jgi:hypothetical protein